MWDVVSSRCLSLTLIAATSSHSGAMHPAKRCDSFSGYYLKWEDVDVTVAGTTGEPLNQETQSKPLRYRVQYQE